MDFLTGKDGKISANDDVKVYIYTRSYLPKKVGGVICPQVCLSVSVIHFFSFKLTANCHFSLSPFQLSLSFSLFFLSFQNDVRV